MATIHLNFLKPIRCWPRSRSKGLISLCLSLVLTIGWHEQSAHKITIRTKQLYLFMKPQYYNLFLSNRVFSLSICLQHRRSWFGWIRSGQHLAAAHREMCWQRRLLSDWIGACVEAGPRIEASRWNSRTVTHDLGRWLGCIIDWIE
jgi:hypothetical protein